MMIINEQAVREGYNLSGEELKQVLDIQKELICEAESGIIMLFSDYHDVG